jgi:hypothetical protein
MLPVLKIKKKRWKGKFVPVNAIKAYRRRRNLAPLILNTGSRWR